jgi:hypothetical protein
VTRASRTLLSEKSDPTDAKVATDAPGLSVDERRYLLAWTIAARDGGIDVTEDLGLRPWPIPMTAAVIGVFRSGEEFASWLVVGQGGRWTVVSVADSAVLSTSQSLAEALTIIYPMPRTGDALAGALDGAR